MAEDYQPLSVRRGKREPRGPAEGVPPRLALPLQHWLEGMFGYRSSDGMRVNLMHQVALMADVALVPAINNYEIQEQILAACLADEDVFLDVLDATLRAGGSGGHSLKETLQTGGSIWTVSDDGRSLQQRVDTATKAAFDAATSPAGEASSELTEAWANVYGLNPDASDAWDHAIKAVEAVLIPIVVPNKAKATLGDVLGQMKANPGGFVLDLTSSGALGDVETLEALLRLMWPNPDRHGGAATRTPSLLEAEAVVQMSIMVVQWARRGVFKKK